MSRQIQMRRGSADEHTNFVGAVGEVTVDTTNQTLRVHDGKTMGGTMLARAADTAGDWVIETQLPSEENDYTWYRKYKSGWVEQGGTVNGRQGTVTFPVTMANTNYMAIQNATANTGSNATIESHVRELTTTSMFCYNNYANSFCWYVCGVTAN